MGTPISFKSTKVPQSSYLSDTTTYGALGSDNLFLLSHNSSIPGKGKINFDDTLYGISLDQFVDEITDKKQIYLHHTAGGPDAVAVAKYFNKQVGKVATAFIIGARGTIVQCFSSKNWAYHLGLKQEVFTEAGVSYKSLDKISIGIEICNYGPLTKRNGYYYNYVGGKVDYTEVTILDKKYKGHIYWQKYTDAQIESTRQLLVYLCDTYNIPRTYFATIFDIDKIG